MSFDFWGEMSICGHFASKPWLMATAMFICFRSASSEPFYAVPTQSKCQGDEDQSRMMSHYLASMSYYLVLQTSSDLKHTLQSPQHTPRHSCATSQTPCRPVLPLRSFSKWLPAEQIHWDDPPGAFLPLGSKLHKLHRLLHPCHSSGVLVKGWEYRRCTSFQTSSSWLREQHASEWALLEDSDLPSCSRIHVSVFLKKDNTKWRIQEIQRVWPNWFFPSCWWLCYSPIFSMLAVRFETVHSWSHCLTIPGSSELATFFRGTNRVLRSEADHFLSNDGKCQSASPEPSNLKNAQVHKSAISLVQLLIILDRFENCQLQFCRNKVPTVSYILNLSGSKSWPTFIACVDPSGRVRFMPCRHVDRFRSAGWDMKLCRQLELDRIWWRRQKGRYCTTQLVLRKNVQKLWSWMVLVKKWLLES